MTEWKALPGGVLAYGDTGFEIRENPAAPYYDAIQAFDPQNRLIGGRPYERLSYLKAIVIEARSGR